MTTALDERRQDSYLSTLCNYAEIADRRNIENEDDVKYLQTNEDT